MRKGAGAVWATYGDLKIAGCRSRAVAGEIGRVCIGFRRRMAGLLARVGLFMTCVWRRYGDRIATLNKTPRGWRSVSKENKLRCDATGEGMSIMMCQSLSGWAKRPRVRTSRRRSCVRRSMDTDKGWADLPRRNRCEQRRGRTLRPE